jgi:hypothetical protein
MQLLQIWQHQLSTYCVYVQCSKLYVFFKMCVCVHTHVHANTYIHIYIHIYIYIYIYTWVSCQYLNCQFPLSAAKCLSLLSGMEKRLLILYFCVYLCVPFYFGLGHEFHKEGTVVISFVLN